MKIKSIYETEITVQFDDPEKAKQFFLEGDWSEVFWSHDDLEELAADLGVSVKDGCKSWNEDLQRPTVSCDGYGTFVEVSPGVFELSGDDLPCGKITVDILSEEDHTGSHEVDA